MTREVFTRSTAVVTTIAVVALAAVTVQLFAPLFRPDFRPFAMTIEQWDNARGYANGQYVGGTAVYRLDYRRRDDWTLTLVSDEVAPADPGGHGYACERGTYGAVDGTGAFTPWETSSANCDGVGRWIHYGLASSVPSPWAKAVSDDQVTYTLTGERVVFDLRSGLPLLYESGLTTGTALHREIFRVDPRL